MSSCVQSSMKKGYQLFVWEDGSHVQAAKPDIKISEVPEDTYVEN